MTPDRVTREHAAFSLEGSKQLAARIGALLAGRSEAGASRIVEEIMVFNVQEKSE